LLYAVLRSPTWRAVTRRFAACHAKSMDGYLFQLVAIRSHNDELRTRFRGGTIIVSNEVKELGDIVAAHALLTMAEATEFDDEEHASGRFLFCARLFRWSISYSGSANPANRNRTKRKLVLSL
jgi:hypothetical protein